MLRTLFDHKLINRLVMLGMIAVVIIAVRPPDVVIFRRIASHSTQIMLLFLLVGIFFLIIDQRRLLFTAFGCAAALCLYFKYAANISLRIPIKTSEPTLAITHTSTSELSEAPELSLKGLIEGNSDVICFLEITPDWEDLLRSRLTRYYPNRAELTRVDYYGLAIYTKYEIANVDTFYFEDIPTLKVDIKLDANHEISIFTTNTNPPLFRRSFEQLRNQLSHLADNVIGSGNPAITTGNYNLDQFSEELQDFRAKANLNDSRKSMSPSLNPPTEHLFYSRFWECLTFGNLYDSLNHKIGITGEYQLLSHHDQLGALQ